MSVGLSDHYWKLALVNLEMLDRSVAQDRFKRFLVELVKWFKSLRTQHPQLIREKAFVIQCLQMISNVVNFGIIQADDEPQFAAIKNIYSFLATVTEDPSFFSAAFNILIDTVTGIDKHYSSSGWWKILLKFFNEDNITTNLDLIIEFLSRKDKNQSPEFWYAFICNGVFDSFQVSMKRTSHFLHFLVTTNVDIDPLRIETCETTLKILSCNEKDNIHDVALFLDKFVPSRVERVQHNSADTSQSILCDYDCEFVDPENVRARCALLHRQNLLPEFLRIFLAPAVDSLLRNSMEELIQSLLRLRGLWRVAALNGMSSETAKMINQDFYSATDQRSYPMVSLVALTFLYDIQCVDKKVWGDFVLQTQLGNDTIISTFETFVSVVGVAFAPLFLGLQEGSLKQSQLKRLPLLEQMRSSPATFADSQGLIGKQSEGEGKKFVFDIRADNYTTETALTFIRTVLQIFEFSSTPRIYFSFLSSFLATQQLFPTSFDLNFGFVAQTFFSDISNLEYLKMENVSPGLTKTLVKLALSSYPWFAPEQRIFWKISVIWALRNGDCKSTITNLSQMNKYFDVDFAVFVPFLLDHEDEELWTYKTASEVYHVANMILSLYTISNKTDQIVPPPELQNDLTSLGISFDPTPVSEYKVRLITLFYTVLGLNREHRTLNHRALIEILALLSNDEDLIKFHRRASLLECAQKMTPDEKRSLELTYCDVENVKRIKPDYPGDLLRSLGKSDIDVALNLLFYYPELYGDFQKLFKAQNSDNPRIGDCINEFLGDETENRREVALPNVGDRCYIVNQCSVCLVADHDVSSFSVKTKTCQNSSTYDVTLKRPGATEKRPLVFPKDETEPEISSPADSQDYSQFLAQSVFFDRSFHHWNANEFQFTFDAPSDFQFDYFDDQTEGTIGEPPAPSYVSRAFFEVLAGKAHLRELEVDEMRARGVGQILTNYPKRTAKIGVIFVGKGQMDQSDILRNRLEDTSPQFRSFLSSLGEIVDLGSSAFGDHWKYDGKMDVKRFTNGRHSVYFSDKRNEVMFHVVPLMPTVETDSQQIIKKRHVGNDHVHVVWNENDREYDTGTISSQFNNAHVIIHPLQNEMFLVTMAGKAPHYKFGPVPMGSVVVDAKALGSLARYLALFADISVRSEPEYEGSHTKAELFRTAVKDLQ